MHMLHSRRKAEIEILTTIKPGRPGDKLQWSLDRRHQLGDVSVLPLPPYHDATGNLANGRTGLHYLDFSNTASSADSLITSIPMSSCSSSPSSSPTSPMYQSTPPPHAQLLQYLVRKMTDFITQAQVRANAMEINARSQ